MTDERFSKTGFLKSYLLPALCILLIPGVGIWFAGHATARVDAHVRDGILAAIRQDATASAEDRARATAFCTATPASVICRGGIGENQLADGLSSVCSEYTQFTWMRRISIASMAIGLFAFLFASGCVALSVFSQRSLHYSFVTGWHVLKVAALLQAIAQGVVAVMLSYWMTVIWINRYVPKLIIFTGIGAVCLVWLIVKAIFTRVDTGFAVDGTLLTEQIAPRFWAHVRTMARRLGTEPPTHIIAGIDDNFFVTENPVFLDGTRIEGRTLFVSISLLKILEKQEADAIIAHELAHFSGDDTTYTKKMTPARVRYGHYLTALHGGGLWSRPLFHFMRLFWLLFQLSLSRMSRTREFRADAVSAETTSPADAGRALLKVMAYASYRRRVEQALFAQNVQHRDVGIAARVATGFASYVGSPSLYGDLSGTVYPHPLDDHPSLDARLAAVRAPIVPSHYAGMLTQPVTDSWLNEIDGGTELEQRMWQAYEQQFADAHQESLAWRYLPANDEERVVVEKFFPTWQKQTKKNDATVRIDVGGIHFSEWPAVVGYDDIKDCAVRDSLGRKSLTIKLHTPQKKVDVPLHRFVSHAEVLEVLQRYMARHHTARSQQAAEKNGAVNSPS